MLATASCKNCGSEFKRVNWHHAICSVCRVKVDAKRRHDRFLVKYREDAIFRERRKELVRKNGKKHREKHLLESRERKRKYQNVRNNKHYINRALAQKVYEKNILSYGTLTCYICKERIIFGADSIDHIVPISKGGKTSAENLGVSHLNCNLSKGAKSIEEYRKWVQTPL